MSIDYKGGFYPDHQLFAVDGDFTQCDPCGMPVISYPFKGDSILSLNDIAIFYPDLQLYSSVGIGTFPNLKPWSPNQRSIVIEQEFIVAQSAFQPMPLNTPYNVAWSIGFQDMFPSGYPSAQIGLAYLVEEGELQDIGGGLSKIRRKWATLPPTRCDIEQFSATFPGFDNADGIDRQSFTQNVASRVQYDYFIYDDLEILSIPLFNQYATNASDAGYRLNSATGMFPAGLIIPAQQYFQVDGLIVYNGIALGDNTAITKLTSESDRSNVTIPSAEQYINWVTGPGGHNLPTEIVAEASTMTRWMGNIWERRTRFIVAQ